MYGGLTSLLVELLFDLLDISFDEFLAAIRDKSLFDRVRGMTSLIQKHRAVGAELKQRGMISIARMEEEREEVMEGAGRKYVFLVAWN